MYKRWETKRHFLHMTSGIISISRSVVQEVLDYSVYLVPLYKNSTMRLFFLYTAVVLNYWTSR